MMSPGSPHVHPMCRTRATPGAIELTPMGVELNGWGRVYTHTYARRVPRVVDLGVGVLVVDVPKKNRSRKRVVIFFGWVFFLIPSGSPHVRCTPMVRTCGEPVEIGLTPMRVELSGSGRVHGEPPRVQRGSGGAAELVGVVPLQHHAVRREAVDGRGAALGGVGVVVPAPHSHDII